MQITSPDQLKVGMTVFLLKVDIRKQDHIISVRKAVVTNLEIADKTKNFIELRVEDEDNESKAEVSLVDYNVLGNNGCNLAAMFTTLEEVSARATKIKDLELSEEDAGIIAAAYEDNLHKAKTVKRGTKK